MTRFFGVLSFIALLLALPGAAWAQPEAQDRLWDAAIAGDTTAILHALEDGADINLLDTRTNQNGRRALNWAAWYNHPDAITVLLANGAELEGKNVTGFTALHHAAESGSVEALIALLEAGANPSEPNGIGRRPIITARIRENMRVVDLLQAATGN